MKNRKIHIISFNTSGFKRSKDKTYALIEHIKNENNNKHTIFCLQECHNSPNLIGLLINQLEEFEIIDGTSSQYAGVITILPKNLFVVNILKKDERIVSVHIKNELFEGYLHNIYAPSNVQQKEAFWETLYNSIPYQENIPQIICGDFNLVESLSDTLSEKITSKKSLFHFNRVVIKLRVSDLSFENNFTFYNLSQEHASRIDRIMVSHNLLEKCSPTHTLPPFIPSNHLPIQTSILLTERIMYSDRYCISEEIFCLT